MKRILNTGDNIFPKAVMFVVCMAPVIQIQAGIILDNRELNEKTKVYVHSANGLIVRDGPSRGAKRIASLGYGDTVTVDLKPSTKPALTVSGIEGTWLKIKTGPKTGYVFSGFVSRFPVADKSKDSFTTYAEKLKAAGIIATVSKEAVSQSAKSHAGSRQIIELKNANMLDAWLVCRRLFGVPESIKWPETLSEKSTYIEDPKKPVKLWASTLELVLNDNKKLGTIRYRLRGEGWGTSYSAEMTTNGGLRLIKHDFAD